jgi:hypothetical protein
MRQHGSAYTGGETRECEGDALVAIERDTITAGGDVIIANGTQGAPQVERKEALLQEGEK